MRNTTTKATTEYDIFNKPQKINSGFDRVVKSLTDNLGGTNNA